MSVKDDCELLSDDHEDILDSLQNKRNIFYPKERSLYAPKGMLLKDPLFINLAWFPSSINVITSKRCCKFVAEARARFSQILADWFRRWSTRHWTKHWSREATIHTGTAGGVEGLTGHFRGYGRLYEMKGFVWNSVIQLFNSLTPGCNWHLHVISPYNISPKSNI